ncbi:MAG: oligosaccharide flippase family protein [Oscillospiraceae bacterium]|jgi:O-antigen/teichoic acid export membrane protein|nr:oligosaccharide flippase family protein [Oscillospiraceae bacterium]
MLNMLKKNIYLKNSFIYTVGVALNQGSNFLLIIILARILSPDDYELMALYSLWVNVCLSFMGLQGASSMNNALNEYNEKEMKSYSFTLSIVSLLFSTVILSIVLITYNLLENIIGFPVFIAALFLLQTAMSQFSVIRLEKNRVLKKAVSAVFWSSSIPLLRLILSLLLTIFVFKNYLGDIYGFFMSAIIIGTIAVVITTVESKGRFNIKYIKYFLPISIPIIFHSISSILIAGTDKYMLFQMLGEGEMGVYSYIFSISLIPTGLWVAINNSWTVMYFDRLKNNETKAICDVTNTYIRLILCVYILILLILPDVIRIIAVPEYHSGITYSVLVMSGGFFTFLYTICATHEVYAKKTIYIPLATIIAASVNVGLNFIFIPHYGAYGAAVSSVASYFCLLLVHFIFSKFVVKNFPIKLHQLFIPAAIIISVTFVSIIIMDMMLIRLIIASVFAIILLIGLIRWYNITKKFYNKEIFH